MSEVKPYFETQLGKLYCGDALEVLKKLPSESVDVVITSPPYWSKRDYGEETMKIWGGDPNCEHEWEFNTRLNSQGGTNTEKAQVGKDKLCLGRFEVREAFCKKCGAWYGQLGLEPTPQMFVEHLVEIFREVKRVLKPTGSLFVNIDDTWAGSGGWNGGGGRKNKSSWERKAAIMAKVPSPAMYYHGAKKKSLALVPELFAVKMVYDEGWILREKILWAKKVHFYKDKTTRGNAMPESVKDRFAHTWEYIFHFTKKPKYYFDLEQVKVPLKVESLKRANRDVQSWKLDGTTKGMTVDSKKRWHEKVLNGAHRGANPGDVVQINVRPFKDAHFAVFPPDIPELLIKAACPEDGTVLDPFAGAGTALVVAEELGRRWVGIEINQDYCEIIKRRFEKEVGDLVKNRRLEYFCVKG